MDLTGPQRFARFAYPPNAHGYCGPEHADEMFALATEDGTGELARLARSFEGAYPYLELLAGCNGRSDPLDARVVEAYWIGNELLDNVSTFDLGRSVDDRFRRRAGRGWGHLEDTVAHGCANHSFHVLTVSPWVGLLRAGMVDDILGIVDDCRISWGRVDAVTAGSDTLVVSRSALEWTTGRLTFGPARPTTIRTLVPAAEGDVVAIHWGWACEVLSARQFAWLRHVTLSQIQPALAVT